MMTESATTAKTESGGPSKKGWLTKEGGVWKTWRKRWFVLESPSLKYFKHEGDKEPAGTIDLKSCGHIRGVQYKKSKFTFQVQTPSRTYYMCGENADDRDKWVEALNSALADLHSVTFKRAVQFSDFELVKLIEKMDDNEKIVQARLHDDESSVFRMRIVDRKDEETSAWIDKSAAEIMILQKFDHPFVETLRHFFQTPDKYCFVSDDVPGMRLSLMLRRGGALPFELVRFLAAEICLGLEHIHNAGLLFPMLSPESVIVTPDGHACLMFSSSKLLSSCRKDYRAPELYVSAAYSAAQDWWCYGCLLFELLMATPPFRSGSEAEMKCSVDYDPAVLSAAIPQDGKNFIGKLLEKRLDKRLTDSSVIKRQDIFHSIDLEQLYKKQLKPPVDVNALTVVLTNTGILPVTPHSGESTDSAFSGFTYVAADAQDNAGSETPSGSGAPPEQL